MVSASERVEEILVKSKQRVAEHGEVFTPAHIVEAMLDLVKDESERIDSRFLEPACGEGNFLVQVLLRKLATVQNCYGKNEFERRHYALLSLMCIYGIELLEDNTHTCRRNLASIFDAFINDDNSPEWSLAARRVLEVNIVQADALTLLQPDGKAIVFPEWGYLGKGKYQRRDFSFENLSTGKNLAQSNEHTESLFGELEAENIFAPVQIYRPMTTQQLAEKGV